MATNFYSGWAISAAINAPLVALVAIGFLAHVPGEWGRAALAAYAALVLAFIAGVGIAESGSVLLSLAAFLVACLVVGIGGPYGLVLACVGLTGVALLPLLGWQMPLHWSLATIAAVGTGIGAVKALMS